MATTARLDLSVWRNDDSYEFPLRVRGLDLTGVAMRAQVRLAPDTPGSPLIDLAAVSDANAQGIRLAGVSVVDGLPVSDLRIRLSKSARQALPYAGEIGEAALLAWALQIAGRTRIIGRLCVLAHTMDSDGAPSGRISGFSIASAGEPGAGATLTIGADDIAELVIDGADLIAPLASQASDAAAAASDSAAAASLSESGAMAAQGTMYPSTAAGLAAVSEGAFFTVVGDGASTYAILHRKVSGAAVEQARYASKAAFEGTGGAALVGYRARAVAAKLDEVVSVLDHQDLVVDGDWTAAGKAAADRLGPRGGEVVWPRGQYRIDDTVPSGAKPVTFRLDSCELTAPQGKEAFRIEANGGGVVGTSESSSVIKMRAALEPISLPSVLLTMTSGRATGRTISGAGAGLRTPLWTWCTRSAQRGGDVGIQCLVDFDNGQITDAVIVAPGFGNTGTPAVRFRGGGHAAVVNKGARWARYSGFSIDMGGLLNVCGLHIGGMWYGTVDRVGALYGTQHDSAVGMVVESRESALPGPTGSYQGSYINQFFLPRFERMLFIGHGSGTITTTDVFTPEALHIGLHGVRSMNFHNAVLQPDGLSAPSDDAREALWHLVNAIGCNVRGGNFETPNRGAGGRAIMLHGVGSCQNFRVDGPLAASFAGDIGDDTLSIGSRVQLMVEGMGLRDLAIGLSHEHRATGWKNVGRQGFYWAGSHFVVGSNNVRMYDDDGTPRGMLDNTAAPGLILALDLAGSIRLYTCSSGANPRPMAEGGSWNPDGIAVGGSGLTVGGTQVVKSRQAALPPAATDAASTMALVNSLRARLTAGAADGHPLFAA